MVKISREDFIRKATPFFPPEALDFAYFQFDTHHFHFHIVPPRKTKKGDFKYFRVKGKTPTITVNSDLCSYDFLLVYLHEVAHYLVYKHYNMARVKSHGEEWKHFFRLLIENLTDQVDLPEDIKAAYLRHSKKIMSSTVLDRELELTLDKYRSKPANVLYLHDLKIGDVFICRNKIFRVDHFARTRARCTLLKNNKRYLISGLMNVEKYPSEQFTEK